MPSAGYEPGDPYCATAGAGLLSRRDEAQAEANCASPFSTKKLDGKPLHPDCVAAVKRAAKICADLGHEVEDASPTLDQAALIPMFMALWSANLAAGIDTVAALTGQTPSPELFEGLTWGSTKKARRSPPANT